VLGVINIPVPLGDRAYEVRLDRLAPDVAADFLASAIGTKTSGVAVLVDGHVAKVSPRVQPLIAALSARLPRVRVFELPAGERCKNLAAVETTCEWLALQGYDRGATLVGIGGGAATDHTGFVAAIYLRGISFVACPTTLLAMVDASVGGKTGVDLPAGKNLVGAFHQPRAVAADLGFLDTLPARELSAGLAEVVKCALIADPALLTTLEAHAAGTMAPDVLANVIAAAVRVKADVVTEDEREGGRRAILNFGHTVGHAVEAASDYELLHGEAVSLGMVAALALGVARGVTAPELLPRTRALLEKLGLPVDVERRLDDATLARVEVDKKRRSDQVRFVLVPRPGETVLQDIGLDELKQQVRAALSRG
jgi:3-dehydroquinate synthase